MTTPEGQAETFAIIEAADGYLEDHWRLEMADGSLNPDLMGLPNALQEANSALTASPERVAFVLGITVGATLERARRLPPELEDPVARIARGYWWSNVIRLRSGKKYSKRDEVI